ncbi:hypothetical protein D0810_18505 [Vibrio cholerae]|uniref:hypothetical protein n=1 Tax=Vibrio cholerae TaxID=666 RepID=UPI000BA97E17|nr:hypothetical protein [Vibrio cholerae]EGQ9579626.1 hypothetical protein [Vibrio cholerae]EGQ9984988.1 hypothetical protein [Vibrio cholerae]EGR2141705.1 hypothetical protein [Vibrio cholerae]EGR2283719.1 hypothetical protein [Vibrio cholerae]EGR5013279.1 hypothetical protein [Vibrio cholerae]
MGKPDVSVVKAKSVQEVFDVIKLDYTNLSIGTYDNINFSHTFPIMPVDYLKYAQNDMSDSNERGLINALSNSKRSIDCQIEVVLRSLNIDPEFITQSALDFCKRVLPERERNIKPLSLRLFCALGLAPSFLISEVRNLRNKVEHEFQIPNEHDVTRALEIAELLINNVKAKELYTCSIDISDLKRKGDAEDGYITGVYFEEDYKTSSFQLTGWRDKTERIKYLFDTNEIQYYFLLRAMFVAEHDKEKLSDSIRMLLETLDIKTPKEFINIARVHR